MKKTVLLVDDTLTVRMFEKLTLGDAYEFIEATNGKLALEMVERQRPDLILLDVTMPELNGVDTLRVLRSQDQTRDIPVIMVTTKSEAEIEGTCRALGCAAFVTKPINREELRARVREAVGA